MSEPTYRVDVVYDGLTHTEWKYDWYLWRLSDDTLQGTGCSETRDDAVLAAADSIRRIESTTEERLYMNDLGEVVAAPDTHSVKA